MQLRRAWNAFSLSAGRLLRPMGRYVDERVDHGDRRFVDFYAATSPLVNGPCYWLVASWLKTIGAETTLDVAGGPGNLATETRGRALNLDSNPYMLKRAAERGVECVRGDAANLPFRDGSFDAAVSTGALHSFTRHGVDSEVLDEMGRVAACVLVLDYRADASPREVSEHVSRVETPVGRLLASGGIGLHGVTDAGAARRAAEGAGLDTLDLGPYVALTDGAAELEGEYPGRRGPG